MTDLEKTSYCGLWCCDCIPGDERIYELSSALSRVLTETGFKHYADFKSKRVPEFKDYDTFVNVLSAFEKLHCYNGCRNGPCSEAGCAVSCKIRLCSTEKGIEGCWDCDTYTTCEHIAKMERFHPDIKHNLAMIKKYGANNWKDRRGRHYNWN